MKTLDELHSLIDAYAKAVHDGDDYSCMEFKTAIDEALRELIADAERWHYVVNHCEWRRHDGEGRDRYSMLCVRLPYEADQSCVATRTIAIDAARKG